MNSVDFSHLNLQPALLENLRSLNYIEMTPIQAQSLPLILAGADVIAQGQTGSGKTAAFGLGMLQKLAVQSYWVQQLVICPTRELADQVAKEIRRLARAIHNIKVLTLCGGMPFGPQIGSLEHGAHIVVGTPGRIEEHARKGNLKLDKVDTLVLDEADRMLEMGFQESLDAIIENIPARRQTLLFSATYPPQIKSIAERVMQQPEFVKVASTHDTNSIDQRFYKITTQDERMQALRLLLAAFEHESALIFCNTKAETRDIVEFLVGFGFSVVALNGDMEQKDRDRTLVLFANKSTAIMVATDVAARGLDVDDLDLVINYQVAKDPEVHTHRVGRTGRAGSKGIACSLFSDNEAHRLAQLELTIDPILETTKLPDRRLLNNAPASPAMTTIQIDGGKKQKLRPGDILGALTGTDGIDGKQVGKIHMFPNSAFVAVDKHSVKKALTKLGTDKMKGRKFRVRHVRD
ncbi:MAG: ATP-dependent RNA helicase DbpA [Cellvibrionaceae bacterium]|nr:ATP-dependent RNA helicase DbpA [Cellvibrionaceae bacterium]